MIEWMQTHRKWLVITIWVATIAFIGAGFVGWGQFQFGKKADEVAKVGETPVTINDVQRAYNQLFNEYNSALGGKLDDALAKKLGLDKMAYERAIQNALLREYARKLNLYATDKDVAKKILEVFKNEKEYKTYLQNTGQKAAEFEKALRKQILVEKLLNFLELKPSDTFLITVASALFNADNINIKILKRELKVDISEDEIKAYWEKNKNKFLSPTKYKIAITSLPLKGDVKKADLIAFYNENKNNYKNDKGEIEPFEKVEYKVKKDYLAHKLKKEAIIAYKKLKASKGNYKLIEVTLNNPYLPADIMQKLINNGYVKPFVFNDAYVSAKLVEEIKPSPLPYEDAKDQVVEILVKAKSLQALINRAKEELKNFKGQNIGFVTKYDEQKIKNLDPKLATEFLFTMFSSTNPQGFVLVPNKNPNYAVLYKIKEQKLLDKAKYEKNKEYVANLAKAIINMSLLNDLITELYQKYKIVKYIKG
ncbi:MAG: hypothetical protein GXO62_02275 [Epsilonproteobacteria bacterium]|nr:hypothetical protein [Campylobacterota bacterium]